MEEKETKLKIDPKELQPFWKEMEKVRDKYWKEIRNIDNKMKKKFNDKDIEFYRCDGEIVGVGTYPFTDKMDLIHDTEIEKGKLEKWKKDIK